MISRVGSVVYPFEYPDTLIEKVHSLVKAVKKKDAALDTSYTPITKAKDTLPEANKVLDSSLKRVGELEASLK